MKHMKKTLLIVVELSVLAFVLNYILNMGLSYIGNFVTAQFLLFLAGALIGAGGAVYIFRKNLKGLAWEDLPLKRLALIIVLHECIYRIILKKYIEGFEQLMIKKFESPQGDFCVRMLLLLPWELWIIYFIVSTYDKNRDTVVNKLM